jgi:hypothetical protein
MKMKPENKSGTLALRHGLSTNAVLAGFEKFYLARLRSYVLA